MSPIDRGIYETLLTESLDKELATLAVGLCGNRERLRPAEAADRLALHVGRIVRRLIGRVDEKDRVLIGIKLTRSLISSIAKVTQQRLPKSYDANDLAERPVSAGELLRSVAQVLPDGSTEEIRPPKIPLLDTAILTNAPGEPSVGSQVLTEIHSADSIDLVMAFIRFTGIATMLDALRQHMQAGRSLRVLTTTYTGSTEPRTRRPPSSWGRYSRVIRHQYNPLAREELALPPLQRIFNRVYRVIKPDPLRSGHGSRMECPSVRSSEP